MTTTKNGHGRTPTKMIYNNCSDTLHDIKTRQLKGMNPCEIRTLVTGSAATIARFAGRFTKEQRESLGKKVMEIARDTFDGNETAWASFCHNDALFGAFIKDFRRAGGDQIFDDALDLQSAANGHDRAPQGAPVIAPQTGMGEGIIAR